MLFGEFSEQSLKVAGGGSFSRAGVGPEVAEVPHHFRDTRSWVPEVLVA
jgi:hypothetical protein